MAEQELNYAVLHEFFDDPPISEEHRWRKGTTSALTIFERDYTDPFSGIKRSWKKDFYTEDLSKLVYETVTDTLPGNRYEREKEFDPEEQEVISIRESTGNLVKRVGVASSFPFEEHSIWFDLNLLQSGFSWFRSSYNTNGQLDDFMIIQKPDENEQPKEIAELDEEINTKGLINVVAGIYMVDPTKVFGKNFVTKLAAEIVIILPDDVPIDFHQIDNPEKAPIIANSFQGFLNRVIEKYKIGLKKREFDIQFEPTEDNEGFFMEVADGSDEYFNNRRIRRSGQETRPVIKIGKL